MWALSRPNDLNEIFFAACSKRLKNNDSLHQRFDSIEVDLLKEWENYKQNAESAALHLVRKRHQVDDVITKAEFIRLYESGLVRSGPQRYLYDDILALAPNRRCPYCGHRRVRTVDHFLPKTKYPRFSIAPLNLVPCCTDCNKDKSDDISACEAEFPLHPYFDVVGDHQWLGCKVVDEGGPVFDYFVRSDIDMDETLRTRLEYQFNCLSLGSLYSVEAADLMSSIRWSLSQALTQEDNAVRDALFSEFKSSEKHDQNSWRTLFYYAAYRSDWFCKGAFAE